MMSRKSSDFKEDKRLMQVDPGIIINIRIMNRGSISSPLMDRVLGKAMQVDRVWGKARQVDRNRDRAREDHAALDQPEHQ